MPGPLPSLLLPAGTGIPADTNTLIYLVPTQHVNDPHHPRGCFSNSRLGPSGAPLLSKYREGGRRRLLQRKTAADALGRAELDGKGNWVPRRLTAT